MPELFEGDRVPLMILPSQRAERHQDGDDRLLDDTYFTVVAHVIRSTGRRASPLYAPRGVDDDVERHLRQVLDDVRLWVVPWLTYRDASLNPVGRTITLRLGAQR